MKLAKGINNFYCVDLSNTFYLRFFSSENQNTHAIPPLEASTTRVFGTAEWFLNAFPFILHNFYNIILMWFELDIPDSI